MFILYVPTSLKVDDEHDGNVGKNREEKVNFSFVGRRRCYHEI